MNKFQRETATQLADMPHEFAGHGDGPCAVCTTGYADLRHTVWEKEELASRERASASMDRELGS